MRSEDEKSRSENATKQAELKEAEAKKADVLQKAEVRKTERDEALTEALEESFPASDPISTLRTAKSGF
jgi:hypothetical protein